MSDRLYGEKSYWDERYSSGFNESNETDEWLLSFGDIEPILQNLLMFGHHSRVLDVGCGNSKLLRDMRMSGHTGKLVGIDISGINAAKEACDGHDIIIMEADGRTCYKHSIFEENSFDVILDKSTIDAMLCDTKNGMRNIREYANQVSYMCNPGGCFFVISHNHPGTADCDNEDELDEKEAEAEAEEVMGEWLREIVKGLTSNGNSWNLDIHSSDPGCDDDESKDQDQEAVPFPNIYVFTKARRSTRRRRVKRKRKVDKNNIKDDYDDGSDNDEIGKLLNINAHEH